jgi:putative membrane protein
MDSQQEWDGTIMKKALGMLALLAMGVSGCSTTAQAPQSAALSRADLEALTAAYQLIAFDLQECTLVQRQNPGAMVQQVAAQICADAQRYQPMLEELAARHDVTLPNRLDYDLEAQYVGLAYHPAPNFDVNYLNDQIASHEQALAVFRDTAGTTTDGQIKELYENAIPVVEKNLVSLRQALAVTPQ